MLITKNDPPEVMEDFRPICLCNTIYKLVTKIMSTRLHHILGKIINPLQSRFIKGQGIEDNIVIVK